MRKQIRTASHFSYFRTEQIVNLKMLLRLQQTQALQSRCRFRRDKPKAAFKSKTLPFRALKLNASQLFSALIQSLKQIHNAS